MSHNNTFFILKNFLKLPLIKIFTIILCLFIWTKAFPAGDYREGYIVTNLGDTIFGFIDYKDWEINPKSIIFTLKRGPIGKTFLTTDILSFGVENKIYRSSIVEIDNSPYRKNEITHSRSPKLVTDTVFLQVLVDGDKRLYQLKDGNWKEHFFINIDDKITTLVYKRYLDDTNRKSRVTSITQYKDQLQTYLQDCSTINEVIPLVEYSREDLMNCFKYYSDCAGPPIQYFWKSSNAIIEFGIMVGISQSQVSIVGQNYGYQDLVNAYFSLSTDPVLGLKVNILFPAKGNGIISMNNELLYNSYLVSSYDRNPETGDEFNSVYLELGNLFLDLNMMLRYSYPIKSGSAFLNGGISIGYAMSITNYSKEIRQRTTSRTVIEGEAVHDPHIFELGLLAGLGGEYKRFSLELRYENGNGMISIYDLRAHSTTYYALFAYRLGKSKRKKF
ncbi:hypothetical protein ACFLU5_03210 [Bacteroidota bacterium]